MNSRMLIHAGSVAVAFLLIGGAFYATCLPNQCKASTAGTVAQVNYQCLNGHCGNATSTNPAPSVAPELSGGTGFLNADALPQLSQLKGKVVLVDFWTYDCINCMRVIPHLNDWYSKYKDKGLVIIGVHTPEFAYERLESNVATALRRLKIEYPVILDNDYAIWKSFANSYWPHAYLIDGEGKVVYDIAGEGSYEETEAAIRKALKI